MTVEFYIYVYRCRVVVYQKLRKRLPDFVDFASVNAESLHRKKSPENRERN